MGVARTAMVLAAFGLYGTINREYVSNYGRCPLKVAEYTLSELNDFSSHL